MSEERKCSACGKKKAVSEMKTCMHNQMHRYVCDTKCMNDFYNPPKRVIAQPAEAEGARRWSELRRLAENANPDAEWFRVENLTCHPNIDESAARLMTAASPTAALELLAALSAVTAERDRLREDRDSQQRVCIAEMEKANQLRAEVEASRLLLEQCNDVIVEDGGVYIELRAFLAGEMPATDVIALLRHAAMAAKEA